MLPDRNGYYLHNEGLLVKQKMVFPNFIHLLWHKKRLLQVYAT